MSHRSTSHHPAAVLFLIGLCLVLSACSQGEWSADLTGASPSAEPLTVGGATSTATVPDILSVAIQAETGTLDDFTGDSEYSFSELARHVTLTLRLPPWRLIGP